VLIVAPLGRSEVVPQDSLVFEARDSAPNPEQVYPQPQRQVKLLRAIENLNARLRSRLLMQLTKGWRAVRNGSSAKTISMPLRGCLFTSGAAVNATS
jgi:hypothetical protein